MYLYIESFKDKYNELSNPAKATIWFTTCNFIIKGIGFISAPIFTRLLDSTQYGLLSVFMSFDQLFLILATWEIQLGAHQKGLFKYEEDEETFTSAVVMLCNAMTVVFFLVLFFFYKPVIKFTNMSKGILLLLFLSLIVRPAYSCFLNKRRKSYDYRIGGAITVLYSIVNVLLPFIGLYIFNRTADMKYALSLVGTSIICLLLYIYEVDFRLIINNIEKCKEYWSFCIKFEGPAVLHSLSFLVLGQADRVMINEMVGSSKAAYYSVAYGIGSVISIFQASLNTSLSPWRYQMLEEHKYRRVKEVTNTLLLIIGSIIILFILVIPEIFTALFPKEYAEALWCVPPVATGVFFMFLYSIFVNIEEYYERTFYVMIVSVACGIINVILNYLLIGRFGYIVCAYTTVFSYILFAAGHYLFMKKTLRDEKVAEQVIDGKSVLIISGTVLIVSLIITFLYCYPVIRYLLFAAMSMILFLNKKKTMETIRSLKN